MADRGWNVLHRLKLRAGRAARKRLSGFALDQKGGLRNGEDSAASELVEDALASPTLPIAKPLHADWAWRPSLWAAPVLAGTVVAVKTKTALGSSVAVFHDCALSDIEVQQEQNGDSESPVPWAVCLDVRRFEGGFLSLAIDLPSAAVASLTRRHVFRMSAQLSVHSQTRIFARLNVRHGPNTEQIVQALSEEPGQLVAEFDMAVTQLNEARIERAWLDLIFEEPRPGRIIVGDVAMTRRPRAAF